MMTSSHRVLLQEKISFSKLDKGPPKIKELQITRAITLKHRLSTLAHNIATLESPKLYIREDWEKGQQLKAETHLEIPALSHMLIIIKLILRAN